MNFSTLDLSVFIGYLCLMMGFGIWIARRSGNESAEDYFLASKSLPWWAVGGSLIASNISTEQILGMNGSGYAIGMAIATYELMAAVTLLIVAKFFLPVFLKRNIYTMPQFLADRYDNRVKTIMAFLWVSLFVFVNITSILYLGGLAIQNILGVPLLFGIIGLIIYSATFSIFGGLKAVVWTDVIQVIILVIGGLLASFMVVSALGDGSYFAGLSTLLEKAPEKFNMILSPGEDGYSQLPGISVLIGGMWVANLYYWGNNQYIIQRALAAKSIGEAQKGVAFAALLKLMMPLIVVVPGIAAFIILQDPAAYGFTGAGISKPDEAFPWVLNNYVTVGFKGLVTAALVAAIGSSISSMSNSASTIFTLDIYKSLIGKNTSDKNLVRIGKITAAATLLIGGLIAPMLGSLGQVFQYIQEYTGFVSPGVVAVFIFGLFWRRATANSALAAIIVCFVALLGIKFLYPSLPFLDRMGFGFLLASSVIVLVSMLENKATITDKPKDFVFRIGLIISILGIAVPSGIKFVTDGSELLWGILILVMSAGLIYALLTEKRTNNAKSVPIETSWFKTEAIFNGLSVIICLILVVIYSVFW